MNSTINGAERLIEDHLKFEYGLNATIDCINAYSNNNYIAQTDTQRYIVKTYPKTHNKAHLNAQLAVLEHLHTLNLQLKTPISIPTSRGLKISELPSGSNIDDHYLVVFSFLQGKFISAIALNEEVSNRWAQAMAELDMALLDFNHYGLTTNNEWDFKNIALSIDKIQYIQNQNLKKLVDYEFQQHLHNQQEHYKSLRCSCIHNDANDQNLLYAKQGVSAIIDFGDICHSYLIAELAIAICYAMLKSNSPVDTLLTMTAAYHAILPLKSNELNVIFSLIKTRLALSITLSHEQAVIHPENTYALVSQQAAIALLYSLLAVNNNRIYQQLKNRCGMSTALKANTQHLKERKKYFSSTLSLSYKEPITLSHGAFQYLYSSDGTTYLDCINNIAHVGHSHPRLARAAYSQMIKLNTNTRYIHPAMHKAAEKLLEKFAYELDTVFFVCSGSEANELALRLAKSFTTKDNILSIEGAYHGNTEHLINISSYKHPVNFDIPDHISLAPLPLGNQETALDETLSIINNQTNRVGAFIAESILSCAGQYPLPKLYLNKIYEAIRGQGGLCIADEIQTGFGRVGDKFWAFEQHQVTPDIVTLGKPMGNGHPIAAVVTRREIANSMANSMEYFNSFGGNPVSCSLASEVLSIIDDEELQRNALTVGKIFKNELESLKSRHAWIKAIRGSGLFIGIEIQSLEKQRPASLACQQIIESMKTQGILLSQDGINRNVIKIKPPMCFNRANVNTVIECLDAVLTKLHEHKTY